MMVRDVGSSSGGSGGSGGGVAVVVEPARQVLHVDGATIRSESALFEYMAAELMAGVKFWSQPTKAVQLYCYRAMYTHVNIRVGGPLL
jgi:hypothetical protein